MAIKGLNRVLQNLQNVRKSLYDNVEYLFIDYSLEWIKKRANANLDKRTSHFWGSDAREWTKKIYKTYGMLENQDMNSASIEFGIGRTGAGFSEISTIAKEQGWEYDVPSVNKDSLGRWTFKDARTGIWVTFSGYQGKSFLYDAFIEYMQDRVWVELYEKAFNKCMRGVIK